jgi:DHA1 family inner membrane transport protein
MASAPLRETAAVRFRLGMRRTARSRLGIPRVVRYSLGWDLVAGLCTGAYTGLSQPFFTKIARGELHAPQALIAVMSAAMFVGYLLSPVWARQMEGKAKMPFVQGSWLIARSLLFLAPFAVTPWAFVTMVGSLQFIGTISTPAYTSLMRDIYPDKTRGRLMGYVRAAMQTLMFLSTLVAGRLLDNHISYRALFPVAGFFGIAASLAFWRVRALPGMRVDNPAEGSSQGRRFAIKAQDLKHYFGRYRPAHGKSAKAASNVKETALFFRDTLGILKYNVPYRWFAASVATYGFANLAVQPLYQLFQIDILHISNTQVANLANFASLWSIVGAFFWGRFMDRYGPPKAVLLSILCIALMPIVYLTAHSIPWLAFASALSGFGFAGIELSYMMSILAYSETGRAAQYQSLHSLLLGVRGVIAPLLAIQTLHFIGYQAMFLVAFIIMLLGCAMQMMAVRTAHLAPNAQKET